MKAVADCKKCLMQWTFKRASVVSSPEEKIKLISQIKGVLANEFSNTQNIASIANKILNSIAGYVNECTPFYDNMKFKSNKAAQILLPIAGDFIKAGKTAKEKLERACLLSSMSNIAPMSAPSTPFEFNEMSNILKNEKPALVIKPDIYELIQNSSAVFYAVDNAGEVGFDALLISELRKMRLAVYPVVKKKPLFEDATLEDACFFNLDKITNKILTSTGWFIPNEDISQLADIYRQCDLIIAKGTGNFEALKSETAGKKAIYMLKAKCEPIAHNEGVNIGQFIMALDTEQKTDIVIVAI